MTERAAKSQLKGKKWQEPFFFSFSAAFQDEGRLCTCEEKKAERKCKRRGSPWGPVNQGWVEQQSPGGFCIGRQVSKAFSARGYGQRHQSNRADHAQRQGSHYSKTNPLSLFSTAPSFIFHLFMDVKIYGLNAKKCQYVSSLMQIIKHFFGLLSSLDSSRVETSTTESRPPCNISIIIIHGLELWKYCKILFLPVSSWSRFLQDDVSIKYENSE